MEQADIAVVGGGASGMMAALSAVREAGRTGSRPAVVLLERNPRVGKKLLLTGNGRCNLTNRNAGPEHYRGDPGARALLDRFPPERIVSRFRELGLLCRELDGGRVYPYSLQASSVLNILRRDLELAGVRTECGFDVREIRSASGGGFVLSSPEASVSARRVILAAGGKACPQTGSDGGGCALAKQLGHAVTPLFPALVQVRTDPARVRALKGVRCPVRAAFRAGGRTLRSASGEVQFADGALSGICIFELSRCAGELGSGAKAELSLDLAPEHSGEALLALLGEAARSGGELTADRLTEGFLPKALGVELAKYALGGVSKPASALSGGELGRLAAAVKDFAFPVLGTLSWEHAQVTAGGVPLSELDENLESKKAGGLFLCGELLDVDGDCGGFNLHWAWASGIAAGEAAARR